ncbi:MAG: phosphoadenosine phosphosulfate reductase family protein, partial [Caldisericia bacterium]|nr:phosphoadenosine phosphosulfate reductase family protein [Caldisericia bacterium]
MIRKDEKILHAVSGGKDSMVLWYLLKKYEFNVTGVHINLNFDEFSEKSLEIAKNFSVKFSLPLMIFDLKKDFNIDMKEIFLKN